MSILAYDRSGSVRTFDADGRLHIERTPISKANVCEYMGREIPGWQDLGLESDRLYRLLRDPTELQKGAATFNALPLLETHEAVSADSPRRDLVVGATGGEARFEAPYLTNSMVVWDGNAIERIRSGEQRELSCAYAYTPVMEAGTYDGQPYDGRMTSIRGNHVALVEKGRAGPDVIVADSSQQGGPEMADTDKENAFGPAVEALRALMPDESDDAIRAKVSALVASGNADISKPGPGAEDETNDERLNAMVEKMRQDGDFSPEQIEKCRAMCAEMLRAGEGQDEDVTESNSGIPSENAEDESEEERKRREAEGGRKANEIERGERREERAMDSASVQMAIDAALKAERQKHRDADEARRAVRPLVGDVLGMDSAPDIYRYALKHAGIKAEGINIAGLKALVSQKVSESRPHPVTMAADSAKAGYTAPRKY